MGDWWVLAVVMSCNAALFEIHGKKYWDNVFYRGRIVKADSSDIIYDDKYLWDGQLLLNSNAYKGAKELLTDRHDGVGRSTHDFGRVLSNNLTIERCNLLVVEAINKDPNYLSSKRVWYLNPGTYYIMWIDIYDQQGRYWKLFFNSTQPLKTLTGAIKPVIVGTNYFDIQRTYGGLANS